MPLVEGEFQWLRAYDRIIVTAGAREDDAKDAGVFRFDAVHRLAVDAAKKVSDHYPVYARFALVREELLNAATRIARKFDRYTSHHDEDKDGRPDSGEAMTMIDHILLHQSLMPKVARVFIDHGHGGATTDHWPVVVDMAFD